MSDMYREAATATASYASAGPLAGDVSGVREGYGHAQRVRIGVGGTLHFFGPDGTENTIEYNSGDIDGIEIVNIKQDSTAQKITLYWFTPNR